MRIFIDIIEINLRIYIVDDIIWANELIYFKTGGTSMKKTYNELLADLHAKDPQLTDLTMVNRTRVEIAKQVYQLRIDKQLTQKELAKISGVSQAAIVHIERAEVSASFETIGKLTRAMSGHITVKI
ncbi:helix-turn-helix transcriptional regulator [Secundilactobacillus malefermentans]|nr:helix-turn-helix transcriptional regulator [Secundilactobacillus malefermentans]